jgi:hypothetical protein
LDELRQVVRLGADAIQVRVDLVQFVGLEVFLGDARQPLDRGQRRLKVVRNAVGEMGQFLVQARQLLVRGAYLLLGFFPPRVVDERADYEPAIRRINRRQPDFDREFRAVLAASKKSSRPSPILRFSGA